MLHRFHMMEQTAKDRFPVYLPRSHAVLKFERTEEQGPGSGQLSEVQSGRTVGRVDSFQSNGGVQATAVGLGRRCFLAREAWPMPEKRRECGWPFSFFGCVPR